MIRKSGYWFSEKIMLEQKDRARWRFEKSHHALATQTPSCRCLLPPQSTRDGEGRAVIQSNTTAMLIISVLILIVPVSLQAQSARDPGPRVGAAAAGKPLDDLTGPQNSLFNAGIDEFGNMYKVPAGLGPRMNLDAYA